MPVAASVSKRFRFITLVLGIFGLAAHTHSAMASPWGWFFGEDVVGSGVMRQQVRDIGHFTSISLTIPATVELRQGDTERVTIETDDNLIALINTVVENGSLKIQAPRKNVRLQATSLKIIVQARKINGLGISSSGSIYAEGLDAPELTTTIGGSGTIQIKSLQSNDLRISLGGSGNFEAAGKADSVSAAIGGSGSMRMGHLAAKEVSISLGGSGHAVVWAKEALRLSLAGSGGVSYYGDPVIGKSATGSVSVKRLGSSPQ